jgi:N-acetylmuramoyl-L-alanine amidase
MTALLLALIIAFPRIGQKVPYVERCYMIGAVEAGSTNVVVGGRSIPVYRTGAWATIIDVSPGTNFVNVAGSNHWFVVGKKPVVNNKAAVKAKPKKLYEKLPYSGNAPKKHPGGKSPREITIVIDPGHGGSDSGALSPRNLKEKDANLRVALALRDELVKRGYRTVMTRKGDTTVALYDRPKVAHLNNADAFISIHHNAPPIDRDPSILRYCVVYAWNDIGERLGKAINHRIAKLNTQEGVKNNGVSRANYAVTRNPEIPSCLLEIDFITSPEGEEASWNLSRIRRISKAIADGVDGWVKSHVTESVKQSEL